MELWNREFAAFAGRNFPGPGSAPGMWSFIKNRYPVVRSKFSGFGSGAQGGDFHYESGVAQQISGFRVGARDGDCH